MDQRLIGIELAVEEKVREFLATQAVADDDLISGHQAAVLLVDWTRYFMEWAEQLASQLTFQEVKDRALPRPK